MTHRVINIADHEHFADYAELQQALPIKRWRVRLLLIGVLMVVISLFGLIYLLR